MALSPEIALGYKAPEFVNPAQLLSLKQVAGANQLQNLQIEDVYRQRQEQDQLRSIFADPSMLDTNTGTVSLGGIQKALAVSPEKGMSLAKSRAVALKDVAEREKLELGNRVATAKMLRDELAATDAITWPAWVARAKAAGLPAAQNAPAVFDPQWQMRNVQDADKFISQNTPKIELVDIGGERVAIDTNPVTNPGIKGTKLAKTMSLSERETVRHNKVTEAQARLGPPTEVTGPDGKPRLIVQDQKNGRILDANTQQPIEGAVGPKVGEVAQKQLGGVATVKDAITEYRAALKIWKPSDIANPNARARMGTVYNNMLLQAKEAYNLGVLNGPDYMILQEVITNPASLVGGLTTKEALDDQAKKLDEVMTRVGKAVTKTQTGISEDLTPAEQEELKALRARFRRGG
jgi:hypothetical protein